MSDKRLSRTAMREMGLMDDQAPREPDREPVTAAPETEAGRRLLASPWKLLPGEPLMADSILAVEREAAAGTEGRTLDAAYRERNAVVAALIRSNGWATWIVPAPDADGWWIVYAETPTGQVSWHIGAADRDALFAGWNTIAPGGWDGHTTDEKYRRLAALDAAAPTPRIPEDGA